MQQCFLHIERIKLNNIVSIMLLSQGDAFSLIIRVCVRNYMKNHSLSTMKANENSWFCFFAIFRANGMTILVLLCYSDGQNERKTSKGNFYHKVVDFLLLLFVYFIRFCAVFSLSNGWLRLAKKEEENSTENLFWNPNTTRWIEIHEPEQNESKCN